MGHLPLRNGAALAPSHKASPQSDPGSHDAHKHDNEDEKAYQSEDDEAVRLTVNEPSKPRKITQKKAVEQAAFNIWLSRNRPNLSKKASKRSGVQQESLQYMVKSCEGGEKIINSPRDYQLELFERAKHENTIAVLDTGKT